jgi:nitric-oxide synthase, bacterial
MILRRSRIQSSPCPVPDPSQAVLAEAEQFIRMLHGEYPAAGDVDARLAQVRESIAGTGTYEHTPAELQYACRVAWRHAGRCSGRDKWRTLRVRDRRRVDDPFMVAAETVAHLREATNGGRIRSYITVFAPDTPQCRGPRIWNSQVLRYAGYRRADGGITGDPLNVALTDLAMRLGWRSRGGPFDILPLIVQEAGGGPLRMFPVPDDAVLEVPVRHPDFAWFAGLGLRWYAVPVISDMYLDAGGIRYPCAPFNGWYQASTEVGVRNFGDDTRYGMLPEVARGMGLDTSSLSTLWRDRAAVELAVAVQYSFRAAGVMATDHQSEAQRFVRFAEAEEAAGRAWCADWAWVVPPVSGSTTPSFHRAYPDRVLKPGYFRHPDPLASAPMSRPWTCPAQASPS